MLADDAVSGLRAALARRGRGQRRGEPGSSPGARPVAVRLLRQGDDSRVPVRVDRFGYRGVRAESVTRAELLADAPVERDGCAEIRPAGAERVSQRWTSYGFAVTNRCAADVEVVWRSNYEGDSIEFRGALVDAVWSRSAVRGFNCVALGGGLEPEIDICLQWRDARERERRSSAECPAQGELRIRGDHWWEG